MGNAHLPEPQGQWGYIILEQEGASVLKRSDEVKSIILHHRPKLTRSPAQEISPLSTMPNSKARKVYQATRKMSEVWKYH